MHHFSAQDGHLHRPESLVPGRREVFPGGRPTSSWASSLAPCPRRRGAANRRGSEKSAATRATEKKPGISPGGRASVRAGITQRLGRGGPARPVRRGSPDPAAALTESLPGGSARRRADRGSLLHPTGGPADGDLRSRGRRRPFGCPETRAERTTARGGVGRPAPNGRRPAATLRVPDARLTPGRPPAGPPAGPSAHASSRRARSPGAGPRDRRAACRRGGRPGGWSGR